MHTRLSSVLFVLVAVLAVAVQAKAQAADPFVGTWKLDVAKSKFGGPAPRSSTITIEQAGASRKVAVDSVDATGKPVKWGYTSALDGKEAAVTGNPAYDTISALQPNSREVAVTYKKAGKVVSMLKSVVSADGKTLTVASTPTDPASKPSMQVYSKQ